MSQFPCPCCGHRTLSEGPGDYELCRVCFWEDDGGQLRYPLSADGANGISLHVAQQVYLRIGAMDPAFKRKVRKARADEPVDDGWRPFDPALDWTAPALDGDQWPVNGEALYYWRPTYWNGDQYKLPAPPREPTNDDRLVEHLRREVPELHDAFADAERRWGSAGAFRLSGAGSHLALAAYRDRDEQLALRIVTALAPALDEASTMYAPNCVTIAFLENEAWQDPSLQTHIDQWPAAIREELRAQQAFRAEHEGELSRRHADWMELWRTGRGLPVNVIVDRLSALGRFDDPQMELQRQMTARVISNRRWLYRHPLDSALLAWRNRAVRRPWRTLAWLNRPRFQG